MRRKLTKDVVKIKLLVALEAHFYRTPDGMIWNDSVNGYKFWQRYLMVFEEVIVIARVKDVEIANPKWVLSNGENVEFCCLPWYIGPGQFFANINEIKKLVKAEINNCDRFLLRVPGTIGTLVYRELIKRKKKFSLEVVGDPWESLAPGTNKSIVRPFARIYGTISLRRQCRRANALSYVTKHTLQKRYKSRCIENQPISDVILSPDCYVTDYSSIDIKLNNIRTNTRKYDSKRTLTLINVGSMTNLYKGQEYLLKAVKECLNRGYDIKLKLAGGGTYSEIFKKQARELGISDKVEFIGILPGTEAVMSELDKSDVFVLPSLVEGLPRALIEAMARALPCIASNVGGIPELLPPEYLVKPKDYLDLANKIIEVISDNNRMEQISKINLEKSKEFSSDILTARRIRFYNYIKNN